jgi:DnaJ-class molecular chaperone
MQITDEDQRVETCPECRGNQVVEQDERSPHMTVTMEVACPSCNGRGVKLTSMGNKLFDFVHLVMRYRPRAM